MSDERHLICRLPGTRSVASTGFVTPMTGFHVRRVFDEYCPPA
ncbi:hypothetical protein [Acrocarpospora pleiomorpha]|nr:hypothetical protein [Acrocarpospora pleiomorpha]